MNNCYQVRLLRFSNILEISGAWTSDDIGGLLDAMEYGDRTGMSDEELREMCILSLQDLKPVGAAYAVLKHDMSDVLREGQISDLSHEMLDEKLWEEYSDASLYERLFNVGSLLYAAHPNVFPEPDAACVEIEITAIDTGARRQLFSGLDESFLVRLLADGMDDHAICTGFMVSS